MSRFLPAHLWAMHPLYLADVLLLCAHVASALHSDPQLARDSHFLHGAHPLRSVEVAGTVTYAALGHASLKLALDDGSGPAVQVVVYANSAAAAGLPGGAAGLARALRVGDALVATGALGWGYPSGSAAGGVVREVRVQRLRVLRGAGGGLGELCRWWARAQRLHAELYCRPLAALLPSCTPFALAPAGAAAGSGGGGEAAPAAASGAATAAAALPPALPAPLPAPLRLPLPLAAARGGGGGRGALAGLPAPASAAASAAASALAAAAAAPLPSPLFSRLVMLLQNALDLHHPRTTGSALAVSQAAAESRRRARGLAAVRGAVVGGGAGGAGAPAQGGEAGEGGEGGEGSEGGGSGEDSGDGEEGEGGGLGRREARAREAEGRLDASMREEQEWQQQGAGGGAAAAAPVASSAAFAAPAAALAAPAAGQGGMDSDAETVLDEEDALLASAPAAAAAAASAAAPTASSADIAAAFAAGRWVFSVGVSSSALGAALASGATAEEDGSTAIVSTIAASPSVLPESRRVSRGGAGVGSSSSSSSSSSAAPPPAAAIAEVFTVAGAVALLEATEPGILREVCAHLRLAPQRAAAEAAAAVAPSVAEALHCLVDEGVVCAMPSAGRGAPLLFSMVTPRHVIAPATVEVLLGRGAVWDGMAVEEEAAAAAAGEAAVGGGGGGGGAGAAAAAPLPALTEVELVKELRQRLPLRSVPIAVLRAAWRGMEEDAVLVRPSLHTFALPKP